MSIFDKIKPIQLTKEQLVCDMKAKIKQGAEISWFATDTESFDWVVINKDVIRFLDVDFWALEFKTCAIGYFFKDTKQTIYQTFDIEGSA